MSELIQPRHHLPREEIRPAWRAAVLAYRANMRVTRHNSPAWHAAYKAFREVLPEMPEEQAKEETPSHRLRGGAFSPYLNNQSK